MKMKKLDWFLLSVFLLMTGGCLGVAYHVAHMPEFEIISTEMHPLHESQGI